MERKVSGGVIFWGIKRGMRRRGKVYLSYAEYS